MKYPCALGVDLGGTKIEIGLVDHSGKILDSIKVPTDVEGGPKAVVNQIFKAANQLKKRFPKEIPVALGLGIPGQVEASSGFVHFAPNLNWHNISIKDMMNKEMKLPIIVRNDVRMITWGEWRHGAGKGCSNFVAVFVGTGIGGGLVVNGAIVDGFTNTAGEIGHMVIDPRGPVCTCGKRGCVEAFASGWAIAKHAREAVYQEPIKGEKILDLAKGKIDNITAETVSKAFKSKDPLAHEIVSFAFEALIFALVNLVNILNPERIVLGGGVIRGFPTLLKTIRKGVAAKAVPSSVENLEIVMSRLKGKAGVVGAASLALEFQATCR